jgi:hypothetical protein
MFAMRRKSVLMAFGILVLVGCAILGILALMARHEPSFYVHAGVPPGPVRVSQSKAFQTEFAQLIANITNREVLWKVTFSEAQLNSFFAEDFLRSGVAERLLPDNVSAPRVVLEQDRIRLAFRYGTPPWSTIISIDFKIWLAPKQYNVVVLELESLHAGSLPISAQSLLEQLSDALRRHNIEVTWYRHKGNPAAVLRFQSDQARPTVQLRRLTVRNGTLTIVGGSVETAPSPAATPQAQAPKAAASPPLGH